MSVDHGGLQAPLGRLASTRSSWPTKELEQIDKQIDGGRDPAGDRRARARRTTTPDRERRAVDEFMREQVHQPRAVRLDGRPDLGASTSRATSSPTTWPSAPSVPSASSWACDDSSFIQFGYWDSLKKGCWPASGSQHDLKRLESAYLDAEPARVRDHQARLAGAARPAGARQAQRDRRVLRRPAGGAVRPRLSRATTCGGSSRSA